MGDFFANIYQWLQDFFNNQITQEVRWLMIGIMCFLVVFQFIALVKKYYNKADVKVDWWQIVIFVIEIGLLAMVVLI